MPVRQRRDSDFWVLRVQVGCVAYRGSLYEDSYKSPKCHEHLAASSVIMPKAVNVLHSFYTAAVMACGVLSASIKIVRPH